MISVRSIIVVMVLSVGVCLYPADEQRQRNRQLFRALRDGASLETVVTLVEGGADIKSIEQFGGGKSNALHYAAMSNSQNSLLIFYLINFHEVDVNGKDWAKSTPCHVAAAFDRSDCIEIFCQKGANVNAINRENMTPLHFASRNGALKAANTLLMYGATRDVKDSKGKTSVEIARDSGNQEMVKLLENYVNFPEIKEPEVD
jgi:ankyrin repeat protein